jgi:RNA polymerase sigma-70 factor (ECF subfamily)
LGQDFEAQSVAKNRTGGGSFEQRMAQLRGGDEGAAGHVFARFAARLIGLAHRRLDRKVRPKVDPEDVVQSVFKSFFQGCSDGRFDPDGWDGLWGLLACITVRKCIRTNKFFHGQRRDVHREAGPPAGAQGGDSWEGFSRAPTAEEAAVLADTLEQLLQRLEEREQQVCQLRLQGFTLPEISDRVGLTEYTIQGILKKVRKRLQSLQEDAA